MSGAKFAEPQGATPRPGPAPRPERWDAELFVHSARSREELVALLGRSARTPLDDAGLASRASGALSSDPGAERIAIVAGSAKDYEKKAASAASRLADPRVRQIRDITGVYYHSEPLGPSGKLGLLFPGEGAQYPNMLGDLCAHFPSVRRFVESCDRKLKEYRGDDRSLLRLVAPTLDEERDQERGGADAELRELGAAMFSVLVADWAIFELLLSFGLRADAMAGHSMGELAALWAGGCCDSDDSFLASAFAAIDALEDREASAGGDDAVLLAVGAGRADVEQLLAPLGRPDVFVAMDNCPHQSVVVGAAASMARVEAELKSRHWMFERLPLRRFYHTPLFEPYLGPLERMLAQLRFQPPRTPVYSCTTGSLFPDDPEEIRRLTLWHWASRVEFPRMIETMYADGVRLFVESGPRGNLTAFVEDVLRGRKMAALASNTPRRGATVQLLHLLGQLFAHHVPLELGPLFADRVPGRSEPAASPSALVGATAKPALILSGHFAVMDRFLASQESVMRAYLSNRGRAGARAPARRAAPPRRPMIGQILVHEPGRRIVMRRPLRLEEDLLGLDHTVGGRSISRVDPDQHGMPVLPMTFTLEMMCELATLLAPGKTAIGVRDIKLLRWLPYDEEDPRTVEATARLEGVKDGETRAKVEVRDITAGEGPDDPRNLAVTATVRLAERYPTPPRDLGFPLANERPVGITVDKLYMNLFHGERFRGIHALDRLGDDGLESRFRILDRSRLFRSFPEPELLLDSVAIDVAMHPIAGWHLEHADQTGRTLLPIELGSIEVFGPPPPPGTEMISRVRCTDETARTFTHSVEAWTADGRLVYRLAGALYWRFYVPWGETNFHGPKDEYFLSTAWSAGEKILARFPKGTIDARRLDPPGDLRHSAMRLVTGRMTLTKTEWAAFRSLPLPDAELTNWLFSRVAGKDAVRTLWWARTGERLFPADIEIELEEGRPPVVRRRIDDPALDPSRAERLPTYSSTQLGGVFLSLASTARSVGVHAEPLSRADEADRLLSPADRAALAHQGLDHEEWSLRLLVARTALAKALGRDPAAAEFLLQHADAAEETLLISPKDGSIGPVAAHTVRDGGFFVAVVAGDFQ